MVLIFTIIVIILLIIDRKLIFKKINTYLWRRNLNLKQHKQLFLKLYSSVNGFFLSKLDRKQDSLEYLYGEIEFEPFIALISLLKPNEETIFYDLGSGTGKAVVACSLVFPLKKSVGIELLPHLYLCACEQKMKLQAITTYRENAEKIVFFHADFLNTPIHEATIIFINSTAFFGELWRKISLHLESLLSGTYVLSVSKALLSEQFIIEKKSYMEMSWGCVQVFIQKKI